MKALSRTQMLSSLFLGLCAFCVASFQACGGEMVPLAGVIEFQSLRELERELDRQRTPVLLQTQALALWKSGGSFSIDRRPFFSEGTAVVLIVNPLSPGILYSLNSGSGNEEVQIVLSAGVITARKTSSAGNTVRREERGPSDTSPYLVAASFGSEATKVTLLVNGVLSVKDAITEGSPGDFSFIEKSLAVEPSTQFMTYSEPLAAADLNVLSRHLATLEGISGVVFDPRVMKKDGGSEVEESPLFGAAKSVLDQSCVRCHNSSSQGDFRNLTEQQLIQRGWVVPGNPGASKLYSRLRGATEGAGPRNMPTDNSLSVTEIQILRDWILDL